MEKCENFVVGFDEVVKKGQIDVWIHFWDSSKEFGCVTTRYIDSVFLRHAYAQDLLDGFLKCLSKLNMEKLLQVSMDGPNVNSKYLKMLKDYSNAEDSNAPQLADLGSSGLHVMHNAFKIAFKAWNLKPFLRGIYDLFNNLRFCRGDYLTANKKGIE